MEGGKKASRGYWISLPTFIGKGWVSGLFSKLIIDKDGLNKP
jgi:hypothetical protein